VDAGDAGAITNDQERHTRNTDRSGPRLIHLHGAAWTLLV
jgi:hypothetical protein